MVFNRLKLSWWLIHIFAILHAVSAFVFKKWIGYDEIALTFLTIAMAVYLNLVWKRPLYVGLVFAVLATIIGGYTGGIGAELLSEKLGVLQNCITTFVVTEIIGIVTLLMVRQTRYKIDKVVPREPLKKLYLPHIALLTIAIVLYRLCNELVFGPTTSRIDIEYWSFLAITLNNVLLTVALIWTNLIVAWWFSRSEWLETRQFLHISLNLIYLVGLSALCTILVHFNQLLEYGFTNSIYNNKIMSLFMSSLSVNTFIFFASALFVYYKKRHSDEINRQINSRNQATFKYHKLKNQLNPHFLFNSLNVLDYLVQVDQNKASDFIHKMAQVYRYQLQHEWKESLPLNEELLFVNAYYDLLKARFDDALIFDIEGNDENMKQCRIIPCAIQLLLENAAKHNSATKELPLKVTVKLEPNWIVVENNLQPKHSTNHNSLGVGLNSIREQYQLLFNKEVIVIKTEQLFIVKLPIINAS